MSSEDTSEHIQRLAQRIRQGASDSPARLTLAEFGDLCDALGKDPASGKLTVVLLGRRAVAAFPELSPQQIVVAKSFGRITPADFEFAAGVRILGDAGPSVPILRAAAGTVMRHAWWIFAAWIALWWLLLVLGDVAFAARISELALSGSVITFVLFLAIDRRPVAPAARDALVLSGTWQSLDAQDRAIGRLLGAAALISLLGVLLSHSTMVSLQARGYFEPLTSAPVRAVLTSGLSAGSVALFALALAALADMRARRRAVLEDLQAAASLIAARRPTTG